VSSEDENVFAGPGGGCSASTFLSSEDENVFAGPGADDTTRGYDGVIDPSELS
jgi:hypothetical protein